MFVVYGAAGVAGVDGAAHQPAGALVLALLMALLMQLAGAIDGVAGCCCSIVV